MLPRTVKWWFQEIAMGAIDSSGNCNDSDGNDYDKYHLKK